MCVCVCVCVPPVLAAMVLLCMSRRRRRTWRGWEGWSSFAAKAWCRIEHNWVDASIPLSATLYSVDS